MAKQPPAQPPNTAGKPSSFSAASTLLTHYAVLSAGFLAGIGAAYLFLQIPFDFSAELVKARALGIVSLTVLGDYAKTQDILTYLATLIFPAAVALLAWFLWARGSRLTALSELLDPDPEPRPASIIWPISVILLAIFYLYMNFSLSFLHGIGHGWVLLGEEGGMLSWTNYLLYGGVQGKDFFCLYGPLLVYPLYWFFKLISNTIVMARAYTIFLNLLAYAAVFFFLYKTLRTRTVFILGLLFWIVAYPSLMFYSSNCTYLRVILGLVPLYLLFLHHRKPRRYLLALTGLAAAASFLLSQEVGIVSAISVAAVLGSRLLLNRDLKEFWRQCLMVGAAYLAFIAPWFIYFAFRGALIPFLSDLVTYPRLVTLGYGNFAFPPLISFLQEPLDWRIYAHYWAILTYAVAIIALVIDFRFRRFDPMTMLRFSLIFFGCILFRSDLARTSWERSHFISPPVMLLTYLYIDNFIFNLARRRDMFNRIQASAGLVLFILPLVLLTTTTIKFFNWTHVSDATRWAPKFKDMTPGFKLPEMPRSGGIHYISETADLFMKLSYFLNTYTKKGDYVFFFPNEAAYYYLFDRRAPMRFPVTYNAVTRDHRMEIVADLERAKPTYVVYSMSTWRVDQIPETVQVPEIVNYLHEKYVHQLYIGSVSILKRKE